MTANTLYPPLTHDELSSHLVNAQNTDPTSLAVGHNGDSHHPGNLSYASHEYLRDALYRVDQPLTEAVGDGGEQNHILTGQAFESLLGEVGEVSRYTKDKINDLDSAIANRDEMIGVVNDYRLKNYGSDGPLPTDILDPDRPITIADVFDYLDSRQEEIAVQLGSRTDAASLIAKHQASTTLLKGLIKIWEYERPEAKQAWADGGEPALPLDFGSEFNEHLFGGLQNQGENFRKLTEGRIRRLGNEVVDLTAIRSSRSSELGETPLDATQPTPDALPNTKAASPDVTTAVPDAERERIRKLFDSVVDYSHGQTQIRTDILTGYRPIGDGPRGAEKLADVPYQALHKMLREADWRKHPNEAISFFDNEDGSTVRFNYRFQYSSATINSGVDKGELPRYFNWVGSRPGQELAIGVNLPKSMADELMEVLRKNPTSVRDLVERMALGNNDGSLTRDAWINGNTSKQLREKNPIRPPYDGLPDNKWTISFITGMFVSGRPYFDSEQLPVAA
jgi:hypothetical protein